MLIMLPPSEGKTTPARGRPFQLDALSHTTLTPARAQVLAALQRTSARPDAAERLGVGASLAAEVHANITLSDAPAAPAARVYTGVLYAAAGLAHLSGTARRRANVAVRIISGLWGVLTPADRIPAYRLPMGGRLEGFEPLASFWAPRLRAALAPDDAPGSDLVLDCRSGAYAPAWTPSPGRPWLSVRVVAETQGVRKVVSHHAKHTRGVFTHHLLTRSASLPRNPGQVLRAARELIGDSLIDASIHPTPKRGPDVLELVVAG